VARLGSLAPGFQVGAGLRADLVVTKHPQLSTKRILLDLPLNEVIVYGSFAVFEDGTNFGHGRVPYRRALR
jgi:hypothetical protein